MLVVEQYDGHLHVREQGHVLGADPGGGDDDTVYAALFEFARDADFALRFRVGIGQEDRQSVLVGGLLDAADYSGDKRIGDVGYHHSDGVAAPRDQAAGRRAGTVSGFPGDPLNFFHRLPA